jgi:hypothetical protein
MEHKYTAIVPYKDLGWMNGWGDNQPVEFKKCIKAGHQRRVEKTGSCLSVVYCDICEMYYSVDSSD